MSQVTCCPACQTLLKVVPDQLRLSQGWVRCGQCGEVFDAHEHMVDAARWRQAERTVPAQGGAPDADVARSPTRIAPPPPQPAAAGGEPAAGMTPLAPPGAGGAQSPVYAPRPAPQTSTPWPRRPEVPVAPDISSPSGPSDPPAPFEHPALREPATPPPPPAAEDEASFPPFWRMALQHDEPAAHSETGLPPPDAAPSAATGVGVDANTGAGAVAPSAWTLAAGLARPSADEQAPEPPAPSRATASMAEPEPEPESEPKPRHAPGQAAPVKGLDFVIDEAPRSQAVAPPAEGGANPPRPDARRRARSERAEKKRTDPARRSGTPTMTPEELSFVRTARRRAMWRRPMVRMALALGVGLVLGGGLAAGALVQRDWLAARYPELRPVLAQLCAPLGCQVAPYRRIEAIVIESSSFDRISDGLFRLNVNLRNQATLAVAAPALELTLTDSTARTVLTRVLPASEFGAPSALAARRDWSGGADIRIADARQASRVLGYRVLAFYP